MTIKTVEIICSAVMAAAHAFIVITVMFRLARRLDKQKAINQRGVRLNTAQLMFVLRVQRSIRKYHDSAFELRAELIEHLQALSEETTALSEGSLDYDLYTLNVLSELNCSKNEIKSS